MLNLKCLTYIPTDFQTMVGTQRTAWEREINVRARSMDVLKKGARSGTPSKENVIHPRSHFTCLPTPLLPPPGRKPFQHTHHTPFLTVPNKAWCPVCNKHCGPHSLTTEPAVVHGLPKETVT